MRTNALRWIIVAIVVFALGSFMVAYTVNFTEAAVVTTFGKASEGGKPVGAGLHFRLPYPLQSVTKYDTRIRIVETRLETQQTKDDKQVIVEAFCLWRVHDPLKFFRTFSNAGVRADDHYRAAENKLRDLLRSAMALTGQFALTDLFPPNGGESMLGELELTMRSSLRTASADDQRQSLDDYGIEVAEVGISRVLLPTSTSQSVITRMKENRNKLVASIQAAAQAEADRIRDQASSTAKTILSFAERRAQEIRARGDIEAAGYLAQINERPDLAVFLKNLDLWRDALTKRATLVLSTSFPGLGVLQPDVLSRHPAGEIPGSNLAQISSGELPPPESGN
ncbi:MAG: hypothetical protein H6811_04780 [Phycisphaeraceae bacterium]|nr:hypothetical protein [Phycisphaeraceae bacterium]